MGLGFLSGSLSGCFGLAGFVGFLFLIGSEGRVAQDEREKNRVNHPVALHTQLISLPACAGCKAETGFIVKNDT